jgi:choline dehydrogenase
MMSKVGKAFPPADYVIVGAGSAGSVLASRLTENPSTHVTLIEAGGEANSLMVQMPVGFARLVANDKFDWCYEQRPDASINGRRFLWSGGKLLGGGSSINGQVYIRATRGDLDRWKASGATGWGYDDVLPYYMRAEHWHGPASQGRGSLGPLSVSPMRGFHPLCLPFLEGGNQCGFPTLADYNCGEMEGMFLTQTTQRDGWRCSTEKAYLRPARSRPNLTVITEAEVEKIRFAGRRAVGVTLRRDGVRQDIEARGEVIVCAGAMGSPALLMRSGVGPGSYLRGQGIDVVQDIAEVGRNLQEHPSASQHKYVNAPTLNSQMGPLDMVRHLARFIWNRSGPLAAPAVQAMGLVRTRDGLEAPDIQLHFAPLSYDIEPETTSAANANMPKEPTVSIYASLCHPQGRGHVELGEGGRPRIVHELLGDDRDVAAMVSGMKLVDRLFKTPALKAIVVGDRNPAPVPTTDAGWVDYIRAKASPFFHPAGTCRMGSDPLAVVDPQLRVSGLSGLRIVDASVMPTLLSVNTNATAIMIGERAAEMIRRRT